MSLSVGIREDGRVEQLVQSIANLMDSLGFTAEQAMNALKVAEEEQLMYKEMLEEEISYES